jgi:PAS domain S-box-containing protein
MAGLALSRSTDGIAAFWPANGIFLSALLLAAPENRLRHLLCCLVASVVSNAWAGAGWGLALAFTVANLATAEAAFHLLRRAGMGKGVFETGRGVACFLAITLVAVCLGASIAAATIGLAHGNAQAAWLSWACSDVIGIVLVTSLILTTARYLALPSAGRPRRSYAEVALAAVALFATVGAVFAQTRFPLLFVPLAVLLLATYRLGLPAAAAGTMLIAVVGSILTALGRGPIALIIGGAALHIQFFQIYLVTLFGTCLPLALLLAERTRSAAKLEDTNRLLLMAEVVGQIGHWRVDVATQEVFWSDVVCAIHGLPQGYAPRLYEAIDFYHPDERGRITAAVADALESGTPFAFKGRISRPDGETRHVATRGRVERGQGGAIVGLFGVVQDVTETEAAAISLRAASQRLAVNNRMLRVAETVARLGHWRSDLLSGEHFWSEEMYHIFGISKPWQPSLDATLLAYHPEDRDAVRAAIEVAVQAGGTFSLRARIVRPDEKVIHVFVRGEVDRDVSGTSVAISGIVQDVTDQAAAEALLREREAHFRLITDQASDIISLHDLDGACKYVSPAIRSVLGYEPDHLLGVKLDAFIAEDDLSLLSSHRERLQTEAPGTVSTFRFRLRHADGRELWMEASAKIADYADQRRIVSVCRDINDQVAVETELRTARELAEAAVRAKSSFLANMSHEIRTPMNGVIGFTDLLLASDLGFDQRRQAELIADSGRAMMRLLNDILDLSKVEAGQMRIAEEPVDLPHALRACMKLVYPAAAQKGIALECEISADLPKIVMGDGLRLRQVILNLLGNAVKFTEQGSVTLRASLVDREGGSFRIEVEDTGIGIPADRQAAIFEQFVQAENTTAAKFGGTGLGLAISAQLARLMGGDLALRSVLGKGTSFFLSLPCRSCGAVPLATSAETSHAPMSGGSTSGARILVAEDHDVNQLLMTSMLQRLGCAIEVAENGAVAVQRVEEAAAAGRPYSLVLMDMQMPVLDGLEATRRIRAAGMTAEALPIVALTANAYAEDVAACREAGMQAHLAKPVQLETLSEVITRWANPKAVAPAASVAKFSPKIEARYRERKAETLAKLDQTLQAQTFSDEEAADLASLLHKLAGTAAMFGEPALGEMALAFEQQLESWSMDERRLRFAGAVEAIRRAA